MRLIDRREKMLQYAKSMKREYRTIGLVPTMGYLHDGHMSLVKRSVEQNDCTIVSIYVNPKQFGPSEDLDAYPRDLKADMTRCEEAGVDVVFAPTDERMYDQDHTTTVHVGGVSENLCGSLRPGHFDGVATVVAKLFHLTLPDRAYFGQKDAQQLAVIKRMVRDLDFPMDIVACPIVREPDGLAKSSRNVYLNRAQRSRAVYLYHALKKAEAMVENHETDVKTIERAMRQVLEKAMPCKIEYISFVDAQRMTTVKKVERQVLIALAVSFDTTRLIDNTTVSYNPKKNEEIRSCT